MRVPQHRLPCTESVIKASRLPSLALRLVCKLTKRYQRASAKCEWRYTVQSAFDDPITRRHPQSNSSHASNYPGSIRAASTNAGDGSPAPPVLFLRSTRPPQHSLVMAVHDVLTTPLSKPQHASHTSPPATPSCSRSGKTIRVWPHGTGARRPIVTISPPFVATLCTSSFRFRYLVLMRTHATCCGRHWQT